MAASTDRDKGTGRLAGTLTFLRAAVDRVRQTIGLGEPIGMPPEEQDERSVGWLVPIALWSAAALVLIATAMSAARAGAEWSEPIYWAGMTAIIAAPALRLFQPQCSRRERLGLVLVTGLSLFACKVLHAPGGFVHFDEFLHVATVNDMIIHERLFSLNTLLPISPLFPGLEIVTAAIVKMTGLSVFTAGTVLLVVCRMGFVAGLFLLLERLTGSARIASIACFVYIGSPNFSLFHAQFAYESMAVTLLVLALLVERIDSLNAAFSWARSLTLVGLFIVTLAVTHHTTASFLAGILAIIAVLELLRPVPPRQKARLALLAGIGFVSVLGWSKMTGDPTAGYIGPLIEQGLTELYRFLTGQASARRLFVGDDGVEQSLLRRVISLGATLLIIAGLVTGFLRTLVLAGAGGKPGSWPAMIGDLFRWRDSRLVCIVLLTLAYPVSLAFRLTTGGWELGSRLGAFSFIGVCAVVAVSLCCIPSRFGWSRAGAALIAIVIALGGIIVGWGPLSLPGAYRVSADALSIEQMGIDAADWSQRHLGDGRRFGADRTNRLLLATYGRQRLVTTLLHRIDVSGVILEAELDPSHRYDIRAGNIDYLLVDMRLTLGRPLMGVYFEKGEPPALSLRPPSPAALLKFNALPEVGRPYDSGGIKIFDVRALRHGP